MTEGRSADVLFAGGGLASSLIAWRLAAVRPELRILLLESGPRLGGNHTWSFHGTDLAPDQRRWMEPFVEHSWEGHELRFPGRDRTMGGSYHSFTGERLHAVLARRPEKIGIQTGVRVESLSATGVRLDDGRSLAAGLVIDGRGDDGLPGLELRWQKFLGQVLRLSRPHGRERPLLMDATVPQEDGYRFMYVLPLEPDRVLVEDTFYSDTPALDLAQRRAAVAAYAARLGLAVAGVEREERGVLPIVLGGDIDALWARGDPSVPRIGVRAGLFHMTTGYSLPQAVALADEVAGLPALSGPDLARRVQERSRRHWRAQRFFRLLNRMMFDAAPPAERWRVMDHFYRLPEGLVRRFYAGRLHGWDRVRILSGSPPVPVRRALGALLGRQGAAR